MSIGQISQVVPNPEAKVDLAECERQIRKEVGSLLPSLIDNIVGTVHSCLVSFTNSPYPMVGAMDGWQGLHLFSGFGNTILFTPILARRFARTGV